jgi:hypothetical protein
MNNELDFFEIYPKVDVYKNLLPDSKKLAEIVKASHASSKGKYYLREWDQWSIFGAYTQQKHDPSEPKEYGQMYDDEKYLSDAVYEAYTKAIYDYITRHNLTLPPGASLLSSSFSKYDVNVDTMNNNMSMQYHTDYIISEKDMPGPKFFLTCTTYLNDDYVGGEIEFLIDGEQYPYKPDSGDILVFPSIEPYFHGVKTITSGEKFFVRNFVSYLYEGSEQWLNNQKYHGAVKWAKMEQERLDIENPTNMRYIKMGDNYGNN